MAPTKKNTSTRKKTAPKKKAPARQNGATHVREDKMRKAKKPGKRISASGKTYYERRANRSDIGKLLAAANVFPSKSLAENFAKEKNKTARTYKYVVALYPINKGGDGKAHIVRKIKKQGLGVTTGHCVRQNPDRSSTIYPSSGGSNPCPHGGRELVRAVKFGQLTGAKTTRRKPATAKQKAAQKQFAVNREKAQRLVYTGKAKNFKAAWALLKKK